MKAVEILSELKMSPSIFQKTLQTHGTKLIAGFEAEVIIPKVTKKESEEDQKLKFYYKNLESKDFRIGSCQKLRDFFSLLDSKTSKLDDNKFLKILNQIASTFDFDIYYAPRAPVFDAFIKDVNLKVQDLEKLKDQLFNYDYGEDNSRGRLLERYYNWIEDNRLYVIYTDKIQFYTLMNSFSQYSKESFVKFKKIVSQESTRYQWKQTVLNLKPQLSKIVGKSVDIFSEYHSKTKSKTNYTIEPDRSIEYDIKKEIGLEIVSPPQDLKKTYSDLISIVSWLKSIHATVNESTGFHVNLSFPEKEIDYLKLLVFLGDEYILKIFNRENNVYADSQSKNVKQEIIKTGKFGNYFTKESLRKELESLIARKTKDVSVNFRTEGYIEFRAIGGNWLDKIDLVLESFLRFAKAIVIASDPAASKEEYLKKIGKLSLIDKSSEFDVKQDKENKIAIIYIDNHEYQWTSSKIKQILNKFTFEEYSIRSSSSLITSNYNLLKLLKPFAKKIQIVDKKEITD